MTDESKPNNPHKTHEKLVSMANEIFAQLKRWQELAEMDEATREAQPYPLSDEAEMEDFWKGRQSVIYMETLGIGSLDVYAIAEVLLRAIDRQCR